MDLFDGVVELEGIYRESFTVGSNLLRCVGVKLRVNRLSTLSAILESFLPPQMANELRSDG